MLKLRHVFVNELADVDVDAAVEEIVDVATVDVVAVAVEARTRRRSGFPSPNLAAWFRTARSRASSTSTCMLFP